MVASLLKDAFAFDIGSHPESLRWKKRKVLSAIRDVFGMDVAFISRFSSDQRLFDEIVIDPQSGITGLTRGEGSDLESSYCHRVLQGRIPNIIEDAAKQNGVQDIEATHSIPVGAHISVPIALSDGRVFGMLCAFSRRPDHSLTLRDQAMFELCASLLARDIEISGDFDADLEPSRQALETAIRQGDFTFQAQPICVLGSGQVVGHELFTRFDEALGQTEHIFQNARFLDLVTPVDIEVLRHTVSALSHLPEEQFLSVNLSASSLEEADLPALVPANLAHRLVIELTEHEKIEDYGRLFESAAKARAMGIRLAIDDVGAGYASFRHVLQLRPDIVKIDRQIVAGAAQNPEQQAFVSAICDYSRHRDVRIIAEGLEDARDRLSMEALGVTWGQGYLFGKPVPLRELF